MQFGERRRHAPTLPAEGGPSRTSWEQPPNEQWGPNTTLARDICPIASKFLGDSSPSVCGGTPTQAIQSKQKKAFNEPECRADTVAQCEKPLPEVPTPHTGCCWFESRPFRF